MADTPETLADALAAARAMLDDDSWIDEVTALDEDGEPDDFAQRVVRVNDVRDALDRIEAAAKREEIELREDEAKMLLREYAAAPDESLTPCALELKRELLRLAPAPGNAAAQRESLVNIDEETNVIDRSDLWEEREELLDDALYDIRMKARAALAAPARNCDRFADCNSAWKAYNAIANRERLPGFDFWLFAPEGGAE